MRKFDFLSLWIVLLLFFLRSRKNRYHIDRWITLTFSCVRLATQYKHGPKASSYYRSDELQHHGLVYSSVVSRSRGGGFNLVQYDLIRVLLGDKLCW